MVSIFAPSFPSPSTYADPNPHKFLFRNSNFSVSCSPSLKKSPPHSPPFQSSSRGSDPGLCRCRNQSDCPSPEDDSVNWRWDSALQEVVKNAIKRFDDYKNLYWNHSKNDRSVDVPEREKEKNDFEGWDWERWTKHFSEVEKQERLVSILKSHLRDTIHREEYEEAAKLKVAIAAAATNDTVGRVVSDFNRAIEEERYWDAAFFRDYAGAGLLGWWAGISGDSDDPYGRIIRISAEHGRYVARTYSPRQLATATATATAGVPLFEIFFTMNDKGEYERQAVYLKWNRGNSGDSLSKFSKSSYSSLNRLSDSSEGKSDLPATSSEATEDDKDRADDSDVIEGLSGFQNILQDMIPRVKIKVFNVMAPGKVDRDLISKVIEQIMEEEDEEKDKKSKSVEMEDEVKSESDRDQDEIEMDSDGGISDGRKERSERAVKVVIGGFVQKLSSNVPSKGPLRVPARLERKGHLSFSFSIKEDSRQEGDGKGHTSPDKKANLRGQRSIDHVMSDLGKLIIDREKISTKVLKDVGELINLTLSQAQKRLRLSGSTTFNRIDIPASPDPLNGLYIGSHGLYTSEVINLRRKFGRWQEDGRTLKQPPNLEFYEYVEALKLTGDPNVPAGQIAFRAKVGKLCQLPHKGIFPEEFGVVARYRGQGRLAEPGFRNPRWVDGELVIFDGKYVKEGPVVGFVYWAPEYHFLVFFNRLRLQE